MVFNAKDKKDDRAKELEINEGLRTVNTLGIKWNAEKDILTFNPGNSKIVKLTKR